MNSLQIKEFDLTLRKFISEYELPNEAKRYVIKDILADVTMFAQSEIEEQIRERDEEKKKHRTIYHEDNKPVVTKEETDTEESFF